MLEEDVDVVRARLGLDQAPPSRATLGDVLAFGGWYLASLLMGVVGMVALPALVGLGLWGRWESQRAARHGERDHGVASASAR